MQDNSDEIDISQLFTTIWQGKVLILFFLILFGGLGFLYATKVAVPTYVATATVAIDNTEPKITSFEATAAILSAEQPSLNTEIYLIKSRQLLQRLVVSENLIDDPEFNPLLEVINPFSIKSLRVFIFGPSPIIQYSPDELIRIAVDRLRKKLTVTNPRQSFVFEITLAATSAHKAMLLANSLASNYINDQLLFKEERSMAVIEFLEFRTNELQIELNVGELEVKDFSAQIELISPEALTAKNRQAKELRDRLTNLDNTLDERQNMYDLYSKFTISEATEFDVALLDNRSLVQLFPTIGSNKADQVNFINVLQRGLNQAQTDLNQSQMQRIGLASAVLDLEVEVASQSRDLLTLQQLQREVAATAEIYGYFLTRLKQAEVQQGTQQADARLLSAAVLPRGPSSPNVKMICLLAAILGSLLGVALVLLKEFKKGGLRTAADLQKLTGQTVIGQIPVAPFKRRIKLIPFLKNKMNTPFSESIRNLRTSLLLAKAGVEPCVILVTSSVTGEGKTTTAVALAHSLSGMGKSVLVIEGDLRKNMLREYFQKIKFSENNQYKIKPTTFSESITTFDGLGFDLMLGIPLKQSPADFFSSKEFINIIANVRNTYDHVIIDAPPILPVTDARIIGKYADAILFAVKWDDTRSIVIEAGLNELSNSNLSVSGLVLAKIDPKKAKRYGGATRYGSYYGEYSKPYS
jgi:succinoglycan biosynthesis transport protein ExoP